MNAAPHATVSRRMRPLLGTYVEIGVTAASVEPVADAFVAAFDAIGQVERSLSFHRPDSELSQLNLQPGRWLPLSPLALRVLRLARGMTRATQGLFNCTLGGALVDRGRLPDHGGAPALPVGTAEDIELHSGAARLMRPVRVTLDGIAKGYAVDRAVATLKSHGVDAGWVSAGGDMRAFGDFVLPVRDRTTGATVGLRDAALATSAAGYSYDADFPGELLSPDGRRVVCGRWSVLARCAWRADALTKVAAAANVSCSHELLQRLGGRLLPAFPA